jgi:hypothetical protein
MIMVRQSSYGVMLLGEANREAPAQAELRPNLRRVPASTIAGRSTKTVLRGPRERKSTSSRTDFSLHQS